MSEEKPQEEEVMVIEEAADGGAVVALPDSIPTPDAPANTDPEGSDEHDEAQKRAEIMATGAVDAEAEELRDAKRLKRLRRKEYHKQVANEKDVKLHHLERQNQQLLERLSVVERKTHSADLARVDTALEEQHERILFSKSKIKEAAETGNGDLLVSAQDMLLESTRQFEALANLKKRAVAPQQQRTIQAPDPRLQRLASTWMSNNPWYDPNGGDQDSDIALRIDDRLAKEGFDPTTPDYWVELDDRLQKYLPHRYNGEEDVKPSSRTTRPKAVVTGSGRESAVTNGSKNSFTLSRDQVQAMKDAGMWDDADKRAKMIRRYALEKQQINGSRS